jgi:hypothetical protein
MSAIVRCPVVIVLRSREQRLRDKRPASEIEALLELQALDTTHGLPASLRQFALSLGWSRSKVRAAHARWQQLATEAGDPTACPAWPARESA